jgi:hypothetical protein
MTGIVLQKRVEQVGIILQKRGITKAPSTRVGLALDVSGSARSFYTSSTMQNTIDRLLAVALKFDDNGELDSWLFDSSVHDMPVITERDEGSYVKKQILSRSGLWGGTNYAPPIAAAMEHYFPTTPKTVEKQVPASGFFGKLFGKTETVVETVPVATAANLDPAMLLFITDGANGDPQSTETLLRKAAASNVQIYFNMVGVGDPREFAFLQRLSDELPNVGFVNLASLDITDEQLYEQVVSQEFCDWVKKQA